MSGFSTVSKTVGLTVFSILLRLRVNTNINRTKCLKKEKVLHQGAQLIFLKICGHETSNEQSKFVLLVSDFM